MKFIYFYYFHIKNSTKQGFQFLFLKIVFIFNYMFIQKENIKNINHITIFLESIF